MKAKNWGTCYEVEKCFKFGCIAVLSCESMKNDQNYVFIIARTMKLTFVFWDQFHNTKYRCSHNNNPSSKAAECQSVGVSFCLFVP